MKLDTQPDAIAAIAQRRTQSLTAIVQKELERMIVSGEIGAGERLNEQVLATRLGVSRGPIREATRGLETAGLVTAIVNHGVYVRQINTQEAFELYDLRALIFGYACRQLAMARRPQAIASLSDLVRQMDLAIEAGDDADEPYYKLNLRFHDLVMDLAGNTRAASIYASLVKESHLFRQRSLDRTENKRQSNGEHAAMVEAIAEGDADAACAAAENHHQGGKRRWLATLEE